MADAEMTDEDGDMGEGWPKEFWLIFPEPGERSGLVWDRTSLSFVPSKGHLTTRGTMFLSEREALAQKAELAAIDVPSRVFRYVID